MQPLDVCEIEVVSSLDGSREKSLIDIPAASGAVPLVVGLHTWSYDRFNQLESLLPFCRQRGWGLLLPEFRGPNLATNPRAREAGGSARAITDILDAVAAVRARYLIAEESIFLLGGSGGGHAALLVAAQAPELWRGASVWVPITDLGAWFLENPAYAANIAACCGGNYGTSPEVDAVYEARSPIFKIRELSRVNLSIHHGRHDEVVSWRHTWNLVKALDEVGAKNLYFDIFDGVHEIGYDTAFAWFDGLAGTGESRLALTG